MRKLASIQKVLAIEPIEGADKIEKIKVLGWQLVSKKGEFAVGDLCMYLEIDSVPPDIDAFSFLWKTDTVQSRPTNFRLRSKKLRGVLSQGLALPVDKLFSCAVEEGQDVTEQLGVTKWEPPNTSNSLESAGNFPSHLFPKTDEIRLQSAPGVLDELRGVECYATVKLDGQSLTFARHSDSTGAECIVCTRNLKLRDIPDSPHWETFRRLGLDQTLPSGFAIQGEFCGPGIQSNRLGLKEKKFFAYQVFDIANQKYLDYNQFIEFCSSVGVCTVPIEWVKPLDYSVEGLLSEAEGTYQSGHPREGLVIRPTKESRSAAISAAGGSRASFKVISNTFLLKIGE